MTAVDITEHEETEKQLLQAQKLESIGKFTSSIAHDFNNMLSVIIGNAELLETQDDPVLASESISTILRSASNGASLIEHLLSFSREQELEPVRFAPGQQLQKMLALLQTVTRGNITLKVESAEDDWICFLDPVQF